MISGPKPGDGTTELKFVYDAWNRLVKVTDSSDVAIAEYRYDGQGRRIQRTVDETTDDYYYNEGGQVLEVRRGGEENPLEQYVWDVRYVDAPVVRFYDGDTDGNYLDASDNVLYYVEDANFSVTALVDAASGAVVERYVFDAYGKVSIFTGARDDQGNSTTEWQPRSLTLFDNQILYSGYRRDPVTGLYHTDTREYDAYLGRWLGRDGGGYIDGMNLYQYVSSNPATLVDPSGLCGGTAFDPWNGYGAAGPIGESGVAGPAGAVSPSYADMMISDAPSRSGTALDLWGYDGVWPFDSVYAGPPGDYSDLDVPYEEWDPDAVDFGLDVPVNMSDLPWSEELESPAWAGMKGSLLGLAQGAFNIWCGATEQVIGLINLLDEGFGFNRARFNPFSETDDTPPLIQPRGAWSHNLVTSAVPDWADSVSREVGGASALTLVTLGLDAAWAALAREVATPLTLSLAAPVRTATGETYSVAYEMRLNPADLGRSNTVHFNRANGALDAAIRSDPQFAAQMEELIPGVSGSVSNVGGRATPDGWIWHHATDRGAMQLVPDVQHTPGSIFWDTLHPNGVGGYSIWARPAGAPKR